MGNGGYFDYSDIDSASHDYIAKIGVINIKSHMLSVVCYMHPGTESNGLNV